jgi:hypothetical protein
MEDVGSIGTVNASAGGGVGAAEWGEVRKAVERSPGLGLKEPGEVVGKDGSEGAGQPEEGAHLEFADDVATLCCSVQSMLVVLEESIGLPGEGKWPEGSVQRTLSEHMPKLRAHWRKRESAIGAFKELATSLAAALEGAPEQRARLRSTARTIAADKAILETLVRDNTVGLAQEETTRRFLGRSLTEVRAAPAIWAEEFDRSVALIAGFELFGDDRRRAVTGEVIWYDSCEKVPLYPRVAFRERGLPRVDLVARMLRPRLHAWVGLAAFRKGGETYVMAASTWEPAAVLISAEQLAERGARLFFAPRMYQGQPIGSEELAAGFEAFGVQVCDDVDGDVTSPLGDCE